MSIDLLRNDEMKSLNSGYWGGCLGVARTFGWNPAGTLASTIHTNMLPDDEAQRYIDEWGGWYTSNDYQLVTDEDAKGLSHGLSHAADSLRNGRSLSSEQRIAIDWLFDYVGYNDPEVIVVEPEKLRKTQEKLKQNGMPLCARDIILMTTRAGGKFEIVPLPKDAKPELELAQDLSDLAQFVSKGAFEIG